MRKSVYIVNHPRNPADKQVYMQSFCEAWIASGGEAVSPSRWTNHRLVRHLLKALALLRKKRGEKQCAYLICSRGGHLLKSSLPYLFKGEIIPMLWDCWPATWDILERDLRLMQCRLCFVTASDVVKEMQRRLPNVQFIHVPEGVDINDYTEGQPLKDRSIDVYELGQKHFYYHKKLMDGKLEERTTFVYNSANPTKGPSLVYEDWHTFTTKLADSKIVISFPLCMRNPKKDGNVDTLTMRFWEGMLSRCIIVGHCPQELMNMIGYNPVIEADFVDPCGQLEDILLHLNDYQQLVERNRATALQYAPWAQRMEAIQHALAD